MKKIFRASILLAMLFQKNAIKDFVFFLGLPYKILKRKTVLITIAFLLCFGASGFAATLTTSSINGGGNINANNAVLTGSTADTLYVDSKVIVNVDVTWNFTAVIIQAPNGQIDWTQNSTSLSLPYCTIFDIESGSQGLQPASGGSASKLLVIAGVKIAVANTQSNNAAFSFAEFNALGGLTKFILSSNSPVCRGTDLKIIVTPDRNAVNNNYYYTWSISPSSGAFTRNNTNSSSKDSTTITGVSAGTYMVTCTVKATGDLLATKTIGVTVNSGPTGALSGSQTICNGGSATLSIAATGSGTISGTLSDGTTFSGSAPTILVNVSPATTTTYTISSLSNTCSALSTDLTGNATVTVPTGVPGVWTGTTDKDWFNCRNWADGKIPTLSVDVMVPVVTNAPEINAPGALCKNLTVNGGTLSFTASSATLLAGGNVTIKNNGTTDGTVDMTAGGTLELQGNWNNQVSTAGKGFKYGAGIIIFSGSTTQTISSVNSGETFYNLQINKTSTTDRVHLNKNIMVNNNLTLTQGIFVTENNLFTWNNSGGTLTAPEMSYTANSINYTKSFIATCDASGMPLSVANEITPFTGTAGFKIKNVSSTDTYFPVGASYITAMTGEVPSPNRIMINNQSGSQDFTIVINYGDIGYTNGSANTWKVNRIWYVKSSTALGKATMQLFFTKRDNTGWGTTENEIESGFNYGQCELVQKDYSGIGSNFINLSKGADVQDFLNASAYPENTEIYGIYTIGISKNYTDGIGQFNRFSVVNSGDIVLPVSITNLKAYRKGNGVEIDWTTLNETNVDYYEVERSADAAHFTVKAKIVALNNAPVANYGKLDPSPVAGNNFYRIKAVDKSGFIKYSATVMINITSGKPLITIYPNPIQNKSVNIQFANIAAGKYQLILYSSVGKTVFTKTVEHSGGSATENILLPINIATGSYFIKVFNESVNFVNNLFVE